MTIIRHDYVSATPVNEFVPRIGYTNLFRDGAVTVSSEDSDHPRELAFDGLTYDSWRSTGAATEWIQTQVASQNADYFAIGTHTLAGCTVTPQRSADGSAWTDLETAYAVPDNRPIIWEFTSVAAPYWRLLIASAAGVVSIGAIHVGLRLEMARGLPIGWSPPELNEEVVYTNPMSQGGQILGRNIVRRGVAAQVQSEPVSFTWARADWLAFVEVARLYAVFFWWAYLGKGEIIYGGVDGEQARFTQPTEVNTQFKITGINR